MNILGISAFYHDSAAALVVDGEIVAAAQEERFSRKRHDARFPEHAVRYCLEAGGLNPADLDSVVFYDKPFLKFERLLETYLMFAPSGYSSFRMAMPLWIREKLFQKDLLQSKLKQFAANVDWASKLQFTEHHLSHAASAFFPSPFEEAVVLTMDGVGEWATTSVAHGCGNRLEILKEIHFPHSLGLLYSAFTYYTGFKVNSGEYKLMGLAPYGEPKYTQQIFDHLIDVKPDGSFHLNLDYFNYCAGLTMTNARFHRLFGSPPRRPSEPLTQQHMDIAASIQSVLEEVILRLTRALASETGVPNLCLAGGVALNCVANGKVLRDGQFKNVWIQPASGMRAVRWARRWPHTTNSTISRAASKDVPIRCTGRISVRSFRKSKSNNAFSQGAPALKRSAIANSPRNRRTHWPKGKALGWFQGRMEFGPRALGARSILGDARSPSMQSVLNLKVKYRESFRPFAPSVLRERVSDYFDLDTDSPYMLLVADVAEHRRLEMTEQQRKLFGIAKLNIPRSDIPAVTHVDYSARVQTVHRDTNPRYHALISAFEQRTGCPVIVNTSFNVRGEPIVCTPEDAFHCFMGTEIETLAIGNCFLRKEDQDQSLKRNYEAAFDLD